jgi:hypothetical protein
VSLTKEGKRQEGKIFEKPRKTWKWTSAKKALERVTLTSVHKWKDDRKISQRGMMIEEYRKPKDIKERTKRKSWNTQSFWKKTFCEIILKVFTTFT